MKARLGAGLLLLLLAAGLANLGCSQVTVAGSGSTTSGGGGTGTDTGTPLGTVPFTITWSIPMASRFTPNTESSVPNSILRIGKVKRR